MDRQAKQLTLKNYLFAKALLGLLDSKYLAVTVKNVSNEIDDALDEQFKDKSEHIQAGIVSNILLPLSRELMGEDLKAYHNILKDEYNRVRGELAEKV